MRSSQLLNAVVFDLIAQRRERTLEFNIRSWTWPDTLLTVRPKVLVSPRVKNSAKLIQDNPKLNTKVTMMTAYYSQDKDNGIFVFGGTAPEIGCQYKNSFEVAFSRNNTLQSWRKVGAPPLTRDFLDYPNF